MHMHIEYCIHIIIYIYIYLYISPSGRLPGRRRGEAAAPRPRLRGRAAGLRHRGRSVYTKSKGIYYDIIMYI